MINTLITLKSLIEKKRRQKNNQAISQQGYYRWALGNIFKKVQVLQLCLQIKKLITFSYGVLGFGFR